MTKIYFTTSSSSAFDDAKSVVFSVSGKSAWRTYEIEMFHNSAWKETIKKIRIDPADNEKSSGSTDIVGIAWIEIVSAPGSLSGGIRDEKNNPISNAVVRLEQNGEIKYNTNSNSTGAYFFAKVVAGTYRLVAIKNAYENWFQDGKKVNSGQSLTGQNIVMKSNCSKPTANFTASPTKGTFPLKVSFNASSSLAGAGTISSYKFDFGDGTSGEGKTLSHTYNSEKDFVAKLTVTNSCGLQATKTIEIKVERPCPIPVANFEISNENPEIGESVQFTDVSYAGEKESIKNYTWDFGDGSSSSIANPKHSYSKAGTYTVREEVKNECLEINVVKKTIVVKEKEIIVPDTYRWEEGAWSACEAPGGCGTCFETREIVCIRDRDNMEVSDSYCASKPDTKREVKDESGCQKPLALIKSISPSNPTEGEIVTFFGEGSDADGGTIKAYQWRSSVNGNIGNSNQLKINTLKVGKHTIFFKVQDDEGVWSDEVKKDVEVKEKEVLISKNLPIPFKAQYPPGNLKRIEDANGKLLRYQFNTLTCGHTSFAMIDAYYENRSATVEDIKDLIKWRNGDSDEDVKDIEDNDKYYNDKTTNCDLLKKMAKEYGGYSDVEIHNDWRIKELVKELNNGYPVIVAVYIDMNTSLGGHFMVLRGIDEKNAYFNDPGKTSGGNKSFPIEKFLDVWSYQNYACVVIRGSINGKGGGDYRNDLKISSQANFTEVDISQIVEFDIQTVTASNNNVTKYQIYFGDNQMKNIDARELAKFDNKNYIKILHSYTEASEYEVLVIAHDNMGNEVVAEPITIKVNESNSIQQPYIYTGTKVGNSFKNGLEKWSLEIVGEKSVFEQGEQVSVLTELKNVKTEINFKVELLLDGKILRSYATGNYGVDLQNGWEYAYFTAIDNDKNLPIGSYEVKIFLDTGNGFNLLDTKTFTIISTGLKYKHIKSVMCEKTEKGAIEWTIQTVGEKNVFNKGEQQQGFAELQDVYTDVRFKVEVYFEGNYSWEYETGWYGIDTKWGWKYVYFTPLQNSNVPAGKYEFKIFLDTGNGFQSLSTMAFTINFASQKYNYINSTTCENIVDGEEQWIKKALNPKTTFSTNERIYEFVELQDVFVDVRFKIETYYNNIYSWKYETPWYGIDTKWGWEYVYFTAYQEKNALIGDYEFRIFLDTGSGFEFLTTNFFKIK